MADLYPWQTALWQNLAGRREHAHAYLFSGPAGIGKRELVERFAALLLCLSPVGGQACGQCKGCLLRAAGSHPDQRVVEPEEPEKPIRVDQIRELVEFIVQTSQQGGRKIVVLDPAEAMNLNAANALLKSLEEPSGNTVILLLSHQPGRLLPTIRSRCVQVACPSPGLAQSRAWLSASLPERSDDELQALLHMAGGSPLQAVRLDQQQIREQRDKVIEGVKGLLKRQSTPSQLAEAWKAVPLVMLLDWFIDWSLCILRHQLTADEDDLGLADMRKVLGYLAGKADRVRVMEVQDWLLRQRQKVLNKANFNRDLLIEAVLVQWARLPTSR